MTEYDYSPEAYKRYMSKQKRIAKWVDNTEGHAPEFRNPFVPSSAQDPRAVSSYLNGQNHGDGSKPHHSSTRHRGESRGSRELQSSHRSVDSSRLGAMYANSRGGPRPPTPPISHHRSHPSSVQFAYPPGPSPVSSQLQPPSSYHHHSSHHSSSSRPTSHRSSHHSRHSRSPMSPPTPGPLPIPGPEAAFQYPVQAPPGSYLIIPPKGKRVKVITPVQVPYTYAQQHRLLPQPPLIRSGLGGINSGEGSGSGSGGHSRRSSRSHSHSDRSHY